MECRRPHPARKVAIAAVGSRGDVQPSLVLAAALKSRGCSVWVATEERLKPLVDSFRLEWRRLEGDSAGLLFEPSAQAAIRSRSLVKLMRITQQWESRWDKGVVLRSYETALAGADVIVAGALTLTPSLCVAEASGAGFASLIPGPTWPTAEFPLWALPVPFRCLNHWSYRLAFSQLWAQERPAVDAWRRGLGLPPLRGAGPLDWIAAREAPVLVASSRLCCGPDGRVPGDYPPYVMVGGFLFPEAAPGRGPEPARALKAFVERRGDARPLVYVGFGSMPVSGKAVVALAAGLCDALACRVVVVSGWSDAAAAAADEADRLAEGSLLVVDSAPHGWLFPRCSAIVHHCGVGTMAAALRAGVPQVPCPLMLDQPHNAALCVRLGVAPAAPLWTERLTAAEVAVPLRAILAEKGSGPLCDAARSARAVVEAESADVAARFASTVEQAATSGAAEERGAAGKH